MTKTSFALNSMFGFWFVLLSGILFSLGAIVGSFLNVVIMRTVRDEDWVHGRSHCDSCGKQISWYDNIPLISFVFLKGRCRHCKRRIPLSHPVIELMTGALFVWWYWSGAFFFQLSQAPLQMLQPVFWLAVGVLLLIIFFADLYYFIIPDGAVIALTVLTLTYRLVLVALGAYQWADMGWSLVGVFVAVGIFAFLWWVTRGRGMGLGDVKFAVPLALLTGWPKVLIALYAACALGALVGVGLLASKKRRLGQPVPFGPFLVAGIVVALVWGDPLLAWGASLIP